MMLFIVNRTIGFYHKIALCMFAKLCQFVPQFTGQSFTFPVPKTCTMSIACKGIVMPKSRFSATCIGVLSITIIVACHGLSKQFSAGFYKLDNVMLCINPNAYRQVSYMEVITWVLAFIIPWCNPKE